MVRSHVPVQTNRPSECSKHSSPQSVFGCNSSGLAVSTASLIFFLVNEFVKHYEGRYRQCTTHSNREEDQSSLALVEMVDALEDIRNASKERKEHSEIERHVKTEEGNDWFGQKHLHKPQ